MIICILHLIREELFYTEVMTKSKLKVSGFLETQLNNLGNA
jgi:hypothetical protein